MGVSSIKVHLNKYKAKNVGEKTQNFAKKIYVGMILRLFTDISFGRCSLFTVVPAYAVGYRDGDSIEIPNFLGLQSKNPMEFVDEFQISSPRRLE